MSFKHAFLGASLLTFASVALATPQYTGTTTSDGPLALNQGAGYYIWNDANNTSNWFVRWTAPGVSDDDNIVQWFGDLQFQNQSLNTVTTFQFESSGIHADSLTSFSTPTLDFISWEAATNATGGVDGFNFTIDSDFELMQFALGSSLFAELTEAPNDPGVTSTGIYIGDGYSSTNALVLTSDLGRYQQFEVFVPEPGTLALLGLGLAGLGAARRRQKA